MKQVLFAGKSQVDVEVALAATLGLLLAVDARGQLGAASLERVCLQRDRALLGGEGCNCLIAVAEGDPLDELP